MDENSRIDPAAPARPMQRTALPSIDLGGLAGPSPGAAREALLGEVRQACRSPGFFSVRNSAVSPVLTGAVLAQMQRFFSLADDDPVKQAVHNRLSNGGTGWGPLFGEPAYQAGTVAWVESFDRGPGLAAFADGEDHQAHGVYVNLWPALPGFREAVDAWYTAANQLAEVLFVVFAEMLGLPSDYLLARTGMRAPRTMRLLRYPANEGSSGDGNVGIAAHTDYECFTVMHQTAPGLELTDVEGRWLQAPCEPGDPAAGELVVILGDMMERLTNGHLRATGHRVRNTPWQRDSIILFCALDGDCEVAPLPQFVSADHPAAYAPVRQIDRIKTQLARACANTGRDDGR